jgi:hypothetical protein
MSLKVVPEGGGFIMTPAQFSVTEPEELDALRISSASVVITAGINFWK